MSSEIADSLYMRPRKKSEWRLRGNTVVPIISMITKSAYLIMNELDYLITSDYSVSMRTR